MRRGFILGVLAFGAAAATLFAAYVRVGMGQPWPNTLAAWALIFSVLTVAPLVGAFLSPVAWAYLVGRLERRRKGPMGG